MDNSWKAFECSVITDFISTRVGFSKLFGSWVIISDCFTDFAL